MLSDDFLVSLIKELCKLPNETEWVEFKQDNTNKDEVGEYISALSNSAALKDKDFAYLIWGIRDKDHKIIGTKFSPKRTKVGNEELENWLVRLLKPQTNFQFHEIQFNNSKLTVLKIKRALSQPISFKGQEYIRIGSYKKKLKDFPEKERMLWRLFDRTPFEDVSAIERISEEKVIRFLDYQTYFDLLKLPQPDNRKSILLYLAKDKIIKPCDNGKWNITNLGAILFAKNLGEIDSLKRKSVRVIQYKGVDRLNTLKEQNEMNGYASGFEGLINYVNGILPRNEIIEKALRKEVPMFPEIAVRELVANAIIHQDFLIKGTGPMIEIFSDRIEITNPGKPLIDVDRFLDTPPKSRNETLASIMRRFGICEERGSGIDKVVFQVELFQLPAPLFEVIENFTKAYLFSYKPLRKMDKNERVRACYLHACLKYVKRDFLTNKSLRDRFKIDEKNKAKVSRYIREALDAKMIKPYDEKAAPKMMKYVPFWA